MGEELRAGHCREGGYAVFARQIDEGIGWGKGLEWDAGGNNNM